MSEDAIKIRVGADGATQAAEQIAKLTAQLERQRKTQEMIGKTQDQLRRQNVVDQLKKEAAEVSNVTTVLQRHQQAVANSNSAVTSFGSNTQQLRAKLAPAAALVGNLSNQFSVLVPEMTGATKAFQVFGMAGSQFLGVLGGGPGIVLGGAVAASGALATYMASAKKEADELAKATEANAKAMGSYLDQLQKLRTEVGSARSQIKSEGDLQNRLRSGQGTSEEYGTEIDLLQKRLGNQYYSDSTLKDLLATGKRDEWDKRQMARSRLERQRDQFTSFQSYAEELEANARRNEADKRTQDLELEALGTPGEKKGDGKNPYGPGYGESQAQLEKLRQLYNDNANKIAEDDLRIANDKRQAEANAFLEQLDKKAELAQQAREHEAAMNEMARRDDEEAHARHMQALAANRKMYQDLAVQSSNIIASTAIKSFQMIAKGQKAEVGAILEGIGDQIVAMGTGYIFKGIAESILLNPQGPALIGVGTGAVAFGIGLGAAGARAPGGSSAGGVPASANTFGPRDYEKPSPLGDQNRGPSVINIHMSSTLTPNPDDAIRMKQAADAAFNVYGSAAVPNYAQR
jgi:hypothetical protein